MLSTVVAARSHRTLLSLTHRRLDRSSDEPGPASSSGSADSPAGGARKKSSLDVDKVEKILRGLQSAVEARAPPQLPACAPSRRWMRATEVTETSRFAPPPAPLFCQDERKAIKGERFLEMLVSLGGFKGTIAVVLAKLLNIDPFGNLHWDPTDVAVGCAKHTQADEFASPAQSTATGREVLPCVCSLTQTFVVSRRGLSRMALILPILVTDALLMLPEWSAEPRARRTQLRTTLAHALARVSSAPCARRRGPSRVASISHKIPHLPTSRFSPPGGGARDKKKRELDTPEAMREALEELKEARLCSRDGASGLSPCHARVPTAPSSSWQRGCFRACPSLLFVDSNDVSVRSRWPSPCP